MGTFKIAKTVVKSLFRKPATLMYPVVPREWEERTRGSIGIEVEKCILCGICARRCPTAAIDVDRKGGTWEIHRMQCIQCGACVEACPKDCLLMENQYTEPEAEKVIDSFEVVLEKTDTKGLSTTIEGSLTCDKDECVYCGLCVKTCPCEALIVDRKEKKWEVDEEACVKCGACVEKCPKKCLSLGEEAAEEATKAEKPKKDKKAAKADKTEKKEKAAKKPAAADGEGEVLLCNTEECIFCGLCVKNCPCEALVVDRKEKKWEVDIEACAKCGACMENCPKSCLSFGAPDGKPELKDKKPAKKTAKKSKEKSFPQLDEEKCIYCGACENACPCEAISAEMDDWTLDKEKCVSCGVCIDACPAEALKM
ncbi:MAG: 4Fe-4S binding protein [Bacillota bacterium]|nr:4Fe-4S binding protein [Bacillota bacterium]